MALDPIRTGVTIRSQLPTCLDEATFTAAYTEGWEMSEERAIELVEEIFRGED